MFIMTPIRTFTFLASLALLSIGCEDKAPPPVTTPPKKPASVAPAAPAANPTVPGAAGASPSTVAVLGVTFSLPEGWKSAPPANSMRLAEAVVPDAAGDPAKACSVVFSTAGGGIQPNIDRWAGQIRDSAGNPATPKIDSRTVAGLKVTTVEMSGSYAGMGESAPRPDWAVRGAIFETREGLLFIKMTGPGPAMAAAAPAFAALVDGAKAR